MTPHLVILGGPNGAGKSTVAPQLLRGALAVDHFVNADVIARGLSGFDPDSAAMVAGRIMLERLRALAAAKADFAFETTLASKTLAPFLREQRNCGYRVQIIFLALSSAELAVQRVAERVHRGGHDVPEATIRRRFERGLINFSDLYLPLVDSWQVFDNSRATGLKLLARGSELGAPQVLCPMEWDKFQEIARRA